MFVLCNYLFLYIIIEYICLLHMQVIFAHVNIIKLTFSDLPFELTGSICHLSYHSFECLGVSGDPLPDA